jgi:hypothetical protein
MKIAVCFSGQIRTGNIVAPNILRYIGDLLPNCDFFVHTWDEECLGTGHSRRLQLNDLSPEVHTTNVLDNQEKVTAFFGHYMPRQFVYEQYSLQPTKPLWGGRRWDPVNSCWYVSMWHSLSQANQLKKDYSSKNGFAYDITIRIRPDLVFHPDKSLAEDIKLIHGDNMFLYGAHKGDFGMSRIEDIFWVGPTRVMDAISEYGNAFITLVKNTDNPQDPAYQDWQYHSAWWVKNCLGYTFRALQDNRMRIYYDIDIGKIDYMMPNFGID